MGAGFYSLTPDTGQVTGTHTNFAALVRPSVLETGSLTLTEARSVRFYADSGKSTELPRKVVSADEIWVKLPDSYTSSTTIYMEWDGVSSDYGPTDTYGAENVWGAYDGVFHMQENPGVSDILDSTSNSYDLTPNGGMDFNDNISGAFGGGALDFDGISDYLSSSTTALNIIGDLTLEFWLNADTLSNQDVIMEAGGPNEIEGDNFAFFLRVPATGSTSILQYIHEYGSSGSNETYDFSSAGLSTSAGWQHFVLVRDTTGKDVYLYRDGSLVGTFANYTNNPTGSTNGGFRVAARDNGGTIEAFFDGGIDEVRVRSGTVSADWVSTLYNNQSDNAAFWVAAVASSGVSVSVPVADIAVAAVAPSISTGASVAAPAADIALAAFAPAISTGASVSVPVADIALAALAPTVGSSSQIDVPAAAITIAAFAPTVAAGASVAVPVSDITLAAFAPTVSTGINLAIPVADIAIAGVAPSIVIAEAITVDVLGISSATTRYTVAS